MASLLQHIHRLLSSQQPKLAPLPLVCVPSAAATDEDTQYNSDTRYIGDLLDELVWVCHHTHGARLEPLGGVMSGVLDLLLEDLRDDTQWQLGGAA